MALDVAYAVPVLLVGLVLLAKGADLFIDNAATLARQFGISPHVIGITLVAFATSLPEALVSLLAVTSGHADMGLGNVVGSNISNLGLVLGSACFFIVFLTRKPIAARADALYDSLVMLAVAVLLYIVAYDGRLSRVEGAGFLLLYLGYTMWLLHKPNDHAVEADDGTRGRAIALVALGIVGLLAGAQMTVTGAVGVAKAAGISELIIGLTIVSIGTSLPELAGSLAAAKKGEIAVGNVIGSNIANVLLGLVALASATRSRRRARRYRPLAPVHAGHLRRGRRPRAVAHGTLRRRRAADAVRAVFSADSGAVADLVAALVPPSGVAGAARHTNTS